MVIVFIYNYEPMEAIAKGSPIMSIVVKLQGFQLKLQVFKVS